MSYLSDYVHWNSGHEVPDLYTKWAALSLLGSVAGRRYSFNWGYGKVYCNLFVALVGTANSGKSTAKSFARKAFIDNFPTYRISASVQSFQDIAMKMAQPEAEIVWKDVNGRLQSYHGFYLIVNEMANFFSVDPRKMIDFLVDIYDEESKFSTGFKRQSIDNPGLSQDVENPGLSMLACVQPTWIMNNLKLDLFSGGLGRRLILVCAEKTKNVPEPKPPADHAETWRRIITHLKNVEAHNGDFVKSTDGREWWNKWYTHKDKKRGYDPIWSQFHDGIHVILARIAMLLALEKDPTCTLLTAAHFQEALTMLEELRPGVERLSSGVGRNELAGVGAQVIDFVERLGGAVFDKQLRKHFRRFVNIPEFAEILTDYQNTGQLCYRNVTNAAGVTRGVIMFPSVAKELDSQLLNNDALLSRVQETDVAS